VQDFFHQQYHFNKAIGFFRAISRVCLYLRDLGPETSQAEAKAGTRNKPSRGKGQPPYGFISMACLKALPPEKWHTATVLAPMHRLYSWVNFRPNDETPWTFVRRVQKRAGWRISPCLESSWMFRVKLFLEKKWPAKNRGLRSFWLGDEDVWVIWSAMLMFGMKMASQWSCVAEVSSKTLGFPSFFSHEYYHKSVDLLRTDPRQKSVFVGWYTVSASFFQVRPDWSPKWRSFFPMKGSLKTPKFGSEELGKGLYLPTIGMIMKFIFLKGHDSGMP